MNVPSGSSKLPPVAIEDAAPLSPHNKALYEAGKALLVESVEVGREFCKAMISVCTGAVPIYFGLLKLLLPARFVLTLTQGLALAAPSLLFLIGSAIFAFGYFPQSGQLSLDLPDNIDRERNGAIRHRRRFATIGFVVFVVGSLAAVGASVWAITLQYPHLSGGAP